MSNMLKKLAAKAHDVQKMIPADPNRPWQATLRHAQMHVGLCHQIWEMQRFLTNFDWQILMKLSDQLDEALLSAQSDVLANEAISSWELQTLEHFKRARLRGSS